MAAGNPTNRIKANSSNKLKRNAIRSEQGATRDVLAPEEPNVYRLRGPTHCLALSTERNLPVDEFVETIPFAGAKKLIELVL